jgi:hypothetical protein
MFRFLLCFGNHFILQQVTQAVVVKVINPLLFQLSQCVLIADCGWVQGGKQKQKTWISTKHTHIEHLDKSLVHASGRRLVDGGKELLHQVRQFGYERRTCTTAKTVSMGQNKFG